MTIELLINATPRETRVALLEAGQLQELWLERAEEKGYRGNIYCAKVDRVLPGMQAAFVCYGGIKNGFLHASDLVQKWGVVQEAPDAFPPIHELLHAGDRIFVQVLKEAIGSKGARLSAQLTLPSRYLVLLPRQSGVSVSRRIESAEERERLHALMADRLAQLDIKAGLIVRTAAEGIQEAALAADLVFLERLYAKVEGRGRKAKPGDTLYTEPDLAVRLLRDMTHDSIETVRVDSGALMDRLQSYNTTYFIQHPIQIKRHIGDQPLFEVYGVESEIRRALNRKVYLKSGGYLVIDQTEAMTTVDVNTGAFVGKKSHEETIYRTNLEAAQVLARQLRLRNLGGIIVIDFIDMHDTTHQEKVLYALRQALAGDHMKTHVYGLSALGLVEMTRKRTSESLQQRLCEPCPSCQMRGMIKTRETVSNEILREIVRINRQFPGSLLQILAAPAITDYLLDEAADSVAEVAAFTELTIRIRGESDYGQEMFDVVPL